MSILVPVSAGELVDKITILRVKAARIEEAKRANVLKELALLEAVAADALPDLGELVHELEAVNAQLWDIEEGKRDCERRGDFGPEFIAPGTICLCRERPPRRHQAQDQRGCRLAT